MRNFKGIASNGMFSVGCTGQSVYVYDAENNEVAVFNEIKYGYKAMISPDGDTFVVKSTHGILAIYSYSQLKLLKKVRFDKPGSYDGGFCFSGDGSLFYNIEHIDQTEREATISSIGVYETVSFTKTKEISVGHGVSLNYIENDRKRGALYVLGSLANASGYGGFVAEIKNDEITNAVRITDLEYDYYIGYKGRELSGFAEKEDAGSFFWGLSMKPYKIPDEKRPLSKFFDVRNNL